jgi:hypothetical protein
MNLESLTVTKLCAVAASTIAVIAGFYILQAEADLLEGSFGVALGLYFVAKGLYLGPSLWAQDETRRHLERLVDQARQPLS